jgi:polyhydroxyalkanoate synthase subunit PhaC
VSAIGTLARVPRAAFEFANVILTTPDAPIGSSPRDVVRTHRGMTLYRYRSGRREHPVPVLLERGRHAFGPPGRAHRSDGRLEGQV